MGRGDHLQPVHRPIPRLAVRFRHWQGERAVEGGGVMPIFEVGDIIVQGRLPRWRRWMERTLCYVLRRPYWPSNQYRVVRVDPDGYVKLETESLI